MLNNTRKGFTLLELIVVLVVLGLLAAIAIPTYQAVIDKTEERSVQEVAKAAGRDIQALAAFDRQDFAQTEYDAYAVIVAGETDGATLGAFTVAGLSTVSFGGQDACLDMINGYSGAITVTSGACA